VQAALFLAVGDPTHEGVVIFVLDRVSILQPLHSRLLMHTRSSYLQGIRKKGIRKKGIRKKGIRKKGIRKKDSMDPRVAVLSHFGFAERDKRDRWSGTKGTTFTAIAK
jgi:hypothetical protein